MFTSVVCNKKLGDFYLQNELFIINSNKRLWSAKFCSIKEKDFCIRLQVKTRRIRGKLMFHVEIEVSSLGKIE